MFVISHFLIGDRSYPELTALTEGVGRVDGIIPLAMKRVAGDVEVSHFPIGDDDALRIDVFIQFATDRKAGLWWLWRR